MPVRRKQGIARIGAFSPPGEPPNPGSSLEGSGKRAPVQVPLARDPPGTDGHICGSTIRQDGPEGGRVVAGLRRAAPIIPAKRELPGSAAAQLLLRGGRPYVKLIRQNHRHFKRPAPITIHSMSATN